jgi:hypothetical protein
MLKLDVEERKSREYINSNNQPAHSVYDEYDSASESAFLKNVGVESFERKMRAIDRAETKCH